MSEVVAMTDHERGCEGRNYTCTCGYDDQREAERDKALADLEAFKREVSDAVEKFKRHSDKPLLAHKQYLARFISPPPVDPLVEAWTALWPEDTGIPGAALALRNELRKRGMELRGIEGSAK